jgi:apolipoprotein N-acyltransferase
MSSTERGGRGGLGLAVLSGALLALAFPRADLGSLALVALVPLLLSLQGAARGAALLRGYACGGTFFALLLDWIPGVMRRYGGLPRSVALLLLLLLVFYLATYVALFSWIVAAASRRLGHAALAAAPVIWVALEAARGALLTGFPWGLAGYSQYRNLPLLQAAAVGGIDLVSLLVLAANAGLALLLLPGAGRRARVAGGLLVMLSGAAELAGLAPLRARTEAQGSAVRVAAVQGNVAQDLKWEPGSGERVVADLVRLTRQAGAAGARLVVWPESASPVSFRRPVRRPPESGGGLTVEPQADYTERVGALARDLRVALVAGSVDYRVVDGDLRAYNSAFAVGPDGAIGPSYSKMHLVPFGEYVPLARVLFFVNRMVRGAIAGFAPGDSFDPLPTPVGPAATVICYEAIFPDLVRRIADRGAVLLINITNDAWFGTSAAPRQHLAMAVARAVENRRFLVRAANTGISAIVDPYGRILARTRLMEQTVLVGEVTPRRDLTPFARSGRLCGGVCVILTLLLLAVLRAAPARP